jgi:hypothetical protein
MKPARSRFISRTSAGALLSAVDDRCDGPDCAPLCPYGATRLDHFQAGNHLGGLALSALVALMVGLVLSPDGQIHLQLSNAGLNVSRWVLALVGGIGLVLPPAIVTYLWYLARLRKWSREPDTADERRREHL